MSGGSQMGRWTPPLSTVRTVSAVVATWVGLTCAVIGGVIALRTYQDDVDRRTDERVEKTFQFAQDFNAADMTLLRQKIESAAQRGGACAPSRFKELGVEPHELFSFVGEFDIVQRCVDADLCDEATTDDLFGPYANGFYPQLKRHINRVRRLEAEQNYVGRSLYGFGLKKLAQNPFPLECPDPTGERSRPISN